MVREINLFGIIVLTDDNALPTLAETVPVTECWWDGYVVIRNKHYVGKADVFKSQKVQAVFDAAQAAYEQILHALDESGYNEEFDAYDMDRQARVHGQPRLVPKRHSKVIGDIPF